MPPERPAEEEAPLDLDETPSPTYPQALGWLNGTLFSWASYGYFKLPPATQTWLKERAVQECPQGITQVVIIATHHGNDPTKGLISYQFIYGEGALQTVTPFKEVRQT